MGNCDSNIVHNDDLKGLNRKIDVEIEKERQIEETVIKLLLLGECNESSIDAYAFLFAGAGESGKSTILKQMKSVIIDRCHIYLFSESFTITASRRPKQCNVDRWSI